MAELSSLSTVFGLVQDAITLERALQGAIDRYCDAHETARSLEVFGLNLNADRLHYIERLLSEQMKKKEVRSNAVKNLGEAVKALNEELEKSRAYFQGRKPNRTIPRIWWALHAESKVRKLQEDLQKRLDDIANFLQLVRTTSKEEQESLGPLKQPIFSFDPRDKPKRVLSGLNWSRAHYLPKDASFVKRYNADVYVLVERLLLPKAELKQNNYKDAEQIVRHLRDISEASPNARYYTGLLPCIGYTSSRGQQDLISLLPRNATVEAQPPTSLQKAIVHSREADSSITITLETRFNMALQLARALLAIHTAGFSNCSLRSEKILFVQPLQDEEPVEKVNSVPQKDPLPPPTEPSPKKGSRIQRGASWIKRTATMTGASQDKDQSVAKEDKAEGNKEPRKKASNTSLRSVMSFRNRRGKASEKNPPATSGDPSASPKDSPPRWPENSVLEMGSIPPGGSVFLAYWRNMRDHTAGRSAWRREWHQDLYRHPSLQDTIRFSTGHDIYALGVCLLEIGLWDALVWEDSGVFHVSETLARKLEPHAEKRSKVLEKLTKKGEGSETPANLTKRTEGAEALETLMKKTGGPEKVRQTLIDIATSELPKLMGKGYTTVVQACLECMDKESKKYWNIDFREKEFVGAQLEDREGVCEAVNSSLVSTLSSLSTSISGEEF